VTTIAFPTGHRRDQIQATALELYAARFLPCRSTDFEFAPGTLLAKMQTNGRLEEAHIRAAQHVIADLEHAVGRTEGRITAADDAYDRLRILIDEVLTTRERILFVDVMVNDYFQRAQKGERLPEIGRLLSGYAGKPQATSAAVGRIQALLERISAYYAGETE